MRRNAGIHNQGAKLQWWSPASQDNAVRLLCPPGGRRFHEKGYDEGYEEGYNKGYDKGFDDGYDEGYEKGKSEK